MQAANTAAGAVAAQGLGRQRHRVEADVDGGRVELDEFRVEDLGARRPGQGHSLALQGHRRGRASEQTARAAGRQDDSRGDHFNQGAVLFDHRATDASARVLNQGAQTGAFPDRDVRGSPCRGDQSRQNRAPGTVPADPGHPGAGMGGLQTDGEVAGRGPVEWRAQRGQPLNG
jgi:hypothetical protein